MAQTSWLPIPSGSDFSIANIPFGIISTGSSNTPRPAVAIGEYSLDLATFTVKGGFDALPSVQKHLDVFSDPTLNAFAALGRPTHRAVREYLQNVFADDTPYPSILKSNGPLKKEALIPLKDVRNHLPMAIGDYTDFFAGINHAVNVGTMFRGAANALQPNYLNLPVAYHGRSSSVVVSGTSIRRPRGQILLNPAAEPKVPTFTTSKRLDIELELGFFVCKESGMGESIDVNEAEDSIFGVVLVNDWSARDLQVWEYVPLGPFNAKNFGTSISPWVVLADALSPFMCKGIENKTELQKYLQETRKENMYNINLEVDLTTPSGTTTIISHSNSSNLVWPFPQMLAHHSIAGCPMRVGDLLASGTISGSENGTHGSLLEMSQGGKVNIELNGGEQRKFLEDGDTVTIRGWSGGDEMARVGFGEVVGRIEQALAL